MKRWVSLALLLIALLWAPALAAACTGFAVYSGETAIFGMNFDNPDREYTLHYTPPGEYAGILTVFFPWDDNVGSYTPMLSSNGVFSTVQAHEREPYRNAYEEGEDAVANFAMWTPYLFDTVEGIRNAAREGNLRQVYGSFHSLYADTTGDAMVLEVIGNETVITDIEGDYLVMTNFPNARLADTPMEDLKRIPYGGADRYEIATAYIEENKEGFGPEQGLEMLSLVKDPYIVAPTAFSFVADPENAVAYLVVKGDFDHVWRVDINAARVETYRGFDTPLSLDIGEEGISLRLLEEHAKNEGN